MNIKEHKKYVQNAFVRLARDKIPSVENPDGSSSNTRIPPLMTCISISKEDIFKYLFLSV